MLHTATTMILGLLVSNSPAKKADAKVLPLAMVESYQNACSEHYLLMASAQTAALRGAADCWGQHIRLANTVDLQHAAHMAIIAALVSGLGGAMWRRHLEHQLGSCESARNVLTKTACDYTLWAPFANSAYIVGLPLLAGASPDAALGSLPSNLPSAMGIEAVVFGPYNIFAFARIPLAMRPITEALLSVIFTVSIGFLGL